MLISGRTTLESIAETYVLAAGIASGIKTIGMT